jgi:hypothetical protein
MPLVLEGLQAHDGGSRLAAAHLLHSLVVHAWPRMRVHGGALRPHLQALLLGGEGSGEGGGGGGGGGDVVAAVARQTLELLAWCEGPDSGGAAGSLGALGVSAAGALPGGAC